MNKRTILAWFRNDLRIRDNEMLFRIVERGDTILPVYCFDPRYFSITSYDTKKTGIARAKFILECVADLQARVRELGGELIVRYGYPEEILPELAEKYEVDEVFHHREVADEETRISAEVEAALWELKLNLRHFIGHTLYHKEDLPFPVKDIPDSFNVFKKKTERESNIRPSFEYKEVLRFVEDVPASVLPTYAELGFSPEEEKQLASSTNYLGGESQAQKCLDRFVTDAGSTQSALSPWLAQGCISIHEVYFRVSQEKALPKKLKNDWLLGLWWHDYYRFMFKKHGNQFFHLEGFGQHAFELNNNTKLWTDWKAGKTPDATLNAIMQQLNESGFIPHADRFYAASYLVDRSPESWLAGAAYFEEKLIDYNPANNYGSWAHIAGVGSSEKHNRVLKNKP